MPVPHGRPRRVGTHSNDNFSAIHASDLKLPRGVSLQVDPETLILHVVNQVTAAEPEAEEDTGEVPEPVAEAAEERDGEQAG